ncbi:hypothetical protein [Steroidobacter cummioxidans]|uniref:hypothetical protein n=1 Tax=Steroidobacter cummioxidans TaxID=1803913 RepID=UPI00128FD467|nr:hypothetical protein [Steroidobacter cummioxidans]
MRIIPRYLFSRLGLGLLTVLLFVAPNDPASAQTRAFQMTLWAGSDSAPGPDSDIPTFYDGNPQPAGRSILINFNWHVPVSTRNYEWSRIVAVLIDEPYNDFNGLWGPCWSASDVAAVNARAQVLADTAAAIKSVAPMTRFWVNLAKPQLDWMTGSQCSVAAYAPVNVNRAYIDVISVDVYKTSFVPTLKGYYDWLDTHRAKPDQQMALIPGTFYRVGKDSEIGQASLLQGYFDYANSANQSCDLPWGSRGLTGSFDGCRVWIVMGWLAENHTEGGVLYRGLRDPNSQYLAAYWRTQLALPLRPDLARQVAPGELLPAILPLFLE